jgi:hypothetical protein
MQYGVAAVVEDRDADPIDQRFVRMWRFMKGKRHLRVGNKAQRGSIGIVLLFL